MFKENDYIVVLEKPNGNLNYLPPNFIYKQYKDYNTLYAAKDIKELQTRCDDVTYDNNKTWRYANNEEIKEYERINKPYDVSFLSLKDRYVKILVDNPQSTGFKKGEYVKLVSRAFEYSYYTKHGFTFNLSKTDLYELMPIDFIPNEIPEYVECIKERKHLYGELGKVYKVENWNFSNEDCLLKGSTSGSCNKGRFKLSTKEAYEAQFKSENNFRIGKWYKIMNNWYARLDFIHNSGKRFKFSEKITSDNKHFYESGNIDVSSDIKLLEDLDEIQQYLPNNHPHKKIGEIQYALPENWFVKREEVLKRWEEISFTGDYPVSTEETNELVIPKLQKEKVKIDFNLSTNKIVDIKVNISKKQTKQIKPIKIEKFNLTL